MERDLILPSELPWPDIKGADLEELLYWLLDSMGAKDLEWRKGGRGAGGNDQGRDLEFAFFIPSPDGTLSKQTWWAEAKGRTGTVAPVEVHEAVLNAAGKPHVEVLVIATNARFSNPTRDWVKSWQQSHHRPVVKLWERTDLENLCSKNPIAVVRLHGQALSPQGRVVVAATKLWDYASFSDEPTLRKIWKSRTDVLIDDRALFALVASEFANGDIGERSWALVVPDDVVSSTLAIGLVNFLYLAFRANATGVRQEPLIRAISYLILVATHKRGAASVAPLLSGAWDGVDGGRYPTRVKEMILDPVLATLRTELKDVCASDCKRVLTDPELLADSEVRTYWDRLRVKETSEGGDLDHVLIVERTGEPCKVGFKLGKKIRCPLCDSAPGVGKFTRVVEKVVRFRRSEEEEKRRTT